MAAQRMDPKVIEKSLNKLFSPEWITQTAKETCRLVFRAYAGS